MHALDANRAPIYPSIHPSILPTPPTHPYDKRQTTMNHREHKAALDLARLYMANNSTRPSPPPVQQAAEGGGRGRVTELTPQEAVRAKQEVLAAAANKANSAAAAEEAAADPAMAAHRFASGGACLRVYCLYIYTCVWRLCVCVSLCV
jgi:hypothetical protein